MKYTVILVVIAGVISAFPVNQKIGMNIYGDKFEGDIILNGEQKAAMLGRARNVLESREFHWPNSELPYAIASGHFDEEQIQLIHESLEEFAKVSCVNVRPKTETDAKFVLITGYPDSCFSYVGFQNGIQIVNLIPNVNGNGCVHKSAIQHEFLHALGFHHQQSAWDRDEYVTILWDNIAPGYEYNFLKYTKSPLTQFGVPYDYNSIMHYMSTAFSKNGEETIVPKDPFAIIGQSTEMSDGDIKKLNAMYCY